MAPELGQFCQDFPVPTLAPAREVRRGGPVHALSRAFSLAVGFNTEVAGRESRRCRYEQADAGDIKVR